MRQMCSVQIREKELELHLVASCYYSSNGLQPNSDGLHLLLVESSNSRQTQRQHPDAIWKGKLGLNFPLQEQDDCKLLAK